MFYISWPLLIIWRNKSQFSASKGHTGRLEALVFMWLWSSRYLLMWYHWSDLTNVCILPASWLFFQSGINLCSDLCSSQRWLYTLLTGDFRKKREILWRVVKSFEFGICLSEIQLPQNDVQMAGTAKSFNVPTKLFHLIMSSSTTDKKNVMALLTVGLLSAYIYICIDINIYVYAYRVRVTRD